MKAWVWLPLLTLCSISAVQNPQRGRQQHRVTRQLPPKYRAMIRQFFMGLHRETPYNDKDEIDDENPAGNDLI